jgi:broad specificity phosphatase PhoE
MSSAHSNINDTTAQTKKLSAAYLRASQPILNQSPYWQAWLFGGRRIVFLYLALGLILYFRASAGGNSTGTMANLQNRATIASKQICKTVHFIRHGEAIHNRDAKQYADFYQGRHLSPYYHDAPLTDIGVDQAKNLRNILVQQNILKPDVIISSTLTRALQTAREAFPDTSNHRIVATDLCRERIASYASDKRRSISDLKRDFLDVDFSLVDSEHDVDFDHTKEIHPDPYNSEQCKSRARKFVDWLLYERPEENIAVITHWVFLSHLLKAENIQNQAIFENCEMRSIQLCRET